jgi:hypothetical protein
VFKKEHSNQGIPCCQWLLKQILKNQLLLVKDIANSYSPMGFGAKPMVSPTLATLKNTDF